MATAEADAIEYVKALLSYLPQNNLDDHVLRRWLRGQCEDPHAEVVTALDNLRYLFDRDDNPEPPGIIVVPAGASIDAVQSEIRATLARSGLSTDVFANMQETPRD